MKQSKNFKVGDKIEFSGSIGRIRVGRIEKIWRNGDEVYAHVLTEPIYIWEKKEDLSFAVDLSDNNIVHRRN